MPRTLLALVLLLPASPAAAAVYLAFGDSITEGVGFEECASKEECGYPVRLERLLREAGQDAEVENHGVGGERTTEGVTRIEAVLEGGGDVLLLMEGTNDISREISPETTLFNLDAMAEKAASRGIATVHATLIPRAPTANRDAENHLNEQIAWGIRRLAFEEGRPLADPYEVFFNQEDLFATYYVPGNDPVGHPNAQGFDLLAGTFFDVIMGNDTVPPVPGLVDPPDASERVPSNKEIVVVLFDFGAGIDLAATRLTIDGAPVSATLIGNERRAELRYQPATPFIGVVTAGIRTEDLATPVNRSEEPLSRFIVQGTSFFVGDIDRDGRVDGADLVTFAIHFGARRGEGRYLRAADLNNDATIDGTDLALLASNFGKSSF
jgi:lysophospholipase L1-like esterase